jgi:hypothetical protein
MNQSSLAKINPLDDFSRSAGLPENDPWDENDQTGSGGY